jgi:hypothetical protein
VGALVAAFFLMGPDIRTIFHDQMLLSRKVVKVTACNFAWGVDYEDRHAKDDCFVLEYVFTVFRRARTESRPLSENRPRYSPTTNEKSADLVNRYTGQRSAGLARALIC